MTGADFEGVDLDLLADYVGGALDGTPDEERVAALVAGDPVWQAAYERLVPAMSTVGAMLLELPPEPMPDDLATRLDTLFTTPVTSDEAVAPAVDADEPAPAVPAKVLDLEGLRRDRAAGSGRSRWSRWAAPISVAAGVLAFAGFGLTQISTSSTEDSASTAGEQAAPAAGAAEGVAPMVADSPPVGQILHSGTDYTAGTLERIAAARSLPQTVTGSDAAGSGSGAPGEMSAKGALDRLAAPDLLVACLDEIARENAGGAITAEVADYATFEGAPALIVQFSASNGTWAWAVGPECGSPEAGAAVRAKSPVR